MKKYQSCSVPGCPTGSNDNIPLFQFPKDENTKKKWIKAINKAPIEIKTRSKVCSKHFLKSDYVSTKLNYSKTSSNGDKKSGEWKVLKPTAVPTLNLPEKVKIKISKKDVKIKTEKVEVKQEKSDKEKMPKKHHADSVPSRSRRQASKEALKQMQMLLEDEADTVEIPSDDDVIPVEAVPSKRYSPPPPPPPKKKYKLSHRKSSDGNDREVLVLKTITNRNAENTLDLECWVEELSEIQKERYEKYKLEENEINSKLQSLIDETNAEIIHQSDLSTIYEITEQIQEAIESTSIPQQQQQQHQSHTQSQQQPTSTSANIILNNSGNSGLLVMDSGLGLILGPVTPDTSTTTASSPKVYPGKIPVAANNSSSSPSSSSSSSIITSSERPRRTRSINRTSSPIVTTTRSVKTATMVRAPIVTRNTPQGPKKIIISASPTVTRGKQPNSTGTKPSETNVEGGLATGMGPSLFKKNQTAVVDLTHDDGRPAADSKEISFNKLQGKTYPSLVVVARPQLRIQDISADRSKLDTKVKSVLVQVPTKFTEWLIQQGLVRSEQKCNIHIGVPMKLGMYSDVLKFPYSGGYVWITECCPQRFVSVFNGSLFEGSIHPPVVILKLLYHWACQTNIQNVTQWVKVDNLFVRNTFTMLRAVCTVATQSHIRRLGGPGVKVEVGVISLGTTSQDGNKRQVKVEVLGVLESTSKLIRLRAVEPQIETDRSLKRRFTKILEPLAQWVHPQSVLVTDLTVDKQTLIGMGFTNVVQTMNDPSTNNRRIMEYLRRVIPRMFQNTLSLLSRQIIQQFLDELVWREWFGTTSLQAFENLVMHIADLTKIHRGQSLVARLQKIATNPFKNWAIPVTKDKIETDPTKLEKEKRMRKRSVCVNELIRPPKSNSPDVPEQMVPLENYYYATIEAYNKMVHNTWNVKCPYCKLTFDNNIRLMNHLFRHAHNVSQDAQLCRYCLTSVTTAGDLLKHISSSHPSETKFENGFVCLICEIRYVNPFVLGKHMSKEHCPSEMPYQCGTCGHRCSNHKQAIDHFYKSHDGGPTIQCPFCLKSTTIYSLSRNIVQNMHFFVQHLQKHQKKQYAKRCGKCSLWFVQKDVLKDHQMRMHTSQRGKPGLIPWVAPRNGVMVPKSKMDKYPCDAAIINFTTLYFNINKKLLCKECNTAMDTPKHFPSFESCQNPNCLYSTCCTNAMQEHNAKCRKMGQKIQKVDLPFEMFCVCSFSSNDGNEMARHLAICERKSAYPSKEEAQSATVTHSMLDVLGLVRKPEETKKDEGGGEELKENDEDEKKNENDMSVVEKENKSRKRKLSESEESTEGSKTKIMLEEKQDEHDEENIPEKHFVECDNNLDDIENEKVEEVNVMEGVEQMQEENVRNEVNTIDDEETGSKESEKEHEENDETADGNEKDEELQEKIDSSTDLPKEKDVDEETKEFGEEAKEVDEEIKEVDGEIKEVDDEIKEIDEEVEVKEIDKQPKQVGEEVKEVDEEVTETDKEVKEIDEQTKEDNVIKKVDGEATKMDEVKEVDEQAKEVDGEVTERDEEVKEVDEQAKEVEGEVTERDEEVKEVDGEAKEIDKILEGNSEVSKGSDEAELEDGEEKSSETTQEAQTVVDEKLEETQCEKVPEQTEVVAESEQSTPMETD